jgi:fatty-acid desaturase
MNPDEVPRMRPQNESTNPMIGTVVWSPVKSLWFTTHALISLIGGPLTFSPRAVLLSFAFTVTTLCLGHTLGLHRLLVHRNFACPRWLEYVLVHLGTVVGMGGPFRILHMRDIRDWSQRHESCHAFFIHRNSLWKDFLWQLHCEIKLTSPPRFQVEDAVANDAFYRLMQRTWMLQQLPWAALFYALGGITLVVWGISVRVMISLIGHWLVGYFAHNSGLQDWHLRGHAVQGHNVPHIGLLTMGESWHNNHHAFPGSARLGLAPSQHDPGWWALRTLHVLGLAWDIKLPADLPERPELVALQVAASKPTNSIDAAGVTKDT